MLDYRSLYVKEQVTFRGKGRKIKIGIAKNMRARHTQVNNGLPGDWKNLSDQVLFFAHSTEQFLHGQYSSYSTPLQNLKPGSGGSEIFTVSSHKLALLRLTLWAMRVADYFICLTIVGIFIQILLLIWFFFLS